MNTKEEIINKIKKEIPYVDVKPYSHNIIGLQLNVLAEKYGQEEVEKIVRETNLKNIGWGYILEKK
tara:strand:- start:1120 stop:1317 length:198 start_codon:yes stop_codon:yes gene_type:complete